MAKVFLGCPMHHRSIDVGSATGLWRSSQKHEIGVCSSRMSLLATNCNRLLVQALNAKSFDWFAMLHTDVEPDVEWVDTLIDEAEKHGADLVSAVVPFKEQSGLVSTAIARPETTYSTFCRLTLSQIRYPQFPDTFGIDEAVDALASLPGELRVHAPRTKLLVNTGCMVYRLSHWKPGVLFVQEDAIVQIDGRWQELWQSEDWAFSRLVAEQGGKVMATKKVGVIHHGDNEFRSSEIWGRPRDVD